jgi:hypothetical protein
MRDDDNRRSAKRSLTAAEIKAFWEERLVSQQCATGDGERLIPLFADGVPGWFRGGELGLAFPGPSIVSTTLGEPDQPSLREWIPRARNEARERQNKLIRAKLASSPSKILRARLKPLDEPRGCAGCASCVPNARLRPLRSADAAPPRRLASSSRARRLEHAANARAQQEKRRAEQQGRRAVVRRAARRHIDDLVEAD